MDAHITVITLGVRERAASRRFYVDGLGWTPVLDVEDDVVFIRAGHGLVLGLWEISKLATESGTSAAHHGTPPISLGHNVGSADEVGAVLDTAVAAGATLIQPARRQSWGGVSGYFADPDGFLWEVAFNPGLHFDANGDPVFTAIES